MLSYPIKTRRDDNDTVLASCPDFPEMHTFGEDRNDALRHAVDALEEVIAARVADREDIPAPSKGRYRAVLPVQTEIKVLLYNTMRARNVRKAELARRLRWHAPQVDRLFDFRHASRLDQIEAAFSALDARLNIEVTTEKRARSAV